MAEKVPVVEAPAAKTPDQFLNDAKFVAFLDNYGDAVEPDDLGELERRHESFDLSVNAGKGIKAALKEAFKREVGEVIADSDLKDVDKYVERMAIDEPDKVREILNDAQEMARLPKLIKDNERDLETSDPLLQKLLAEEKAFKGAVNERSENVALVDQYNKTGFLRRQVKDSSILGGLGYTKIGKEQARRGLVDETYRKETEDLKNDLEASGNVIRSVATERFNEIRTKLVGEISGLAGLKDVILARKNAKFDKLAEQFSKGRVESIDQLVDEFDTMAGDESFYEGKDTRDYMVDTAIKDGVKAILKALVDKPLSSRPLETFKRDVEKLSKRERIGNIRGEDVKQLVTDTFDDILSTAAMLNGRRTILQQIRKSLD